MWIKCPKNLSRINLDLCEDYYPIDDDASLIIYQPHDPQYSIYFGRPKDTEQWDYDSKQDRDKMLQHLDEITSQTRPQGFVPMSK